MDIWDTSASQFQDPDFCSARFQSFQFNKCLKDIKLSVFIDHFITDLLQVVRVSTEATFRSI